MKCPYRKIKEAKDNLIIEHFTECYGKECPFYEEAYGVIKEDCARAREDGGMN